jgi:hypothetical protein
MDVEEEVDSALCFEMCRLMEWRSYENRCFPS